MSGEDVKDTLVMYIVMRSDLKDWSKGSLISNGAHAATAVIAENLDDELLVLRTPPTNKYWYWTWFRTRAYLNIGVPQEQQVQMHKVTLGVDSEQKLRDISANLSTAGMRHHLWIEQPEHIAVCLATKPYAKSTIAPLLKALRLFR